ncbi:phosphatase PAP2 family protein [Catenisphaera adipataccumulans]|uniref:Undecaprenyl-diphosphatase n=1 Tax=Catenisphaera adipataccumulans TaxID=700500 RepID=A0A7W8CZ91_9FIRM|nr:phosphatase PAP2 family protein [Catenisphaera adipataccumulans]MBB5182690.1 undecaprenyl-diphosphatase [Catenisphaera adipataccumulans]
MEIQILNTIQNMRTPLLDVLMPLISNGIVVWFLLPVILFIRKSTRKAGLIIFAAILLDIVLCNLVMKNVFQRIRPCDVNTAVTLLVQRPTDYSFPSGHTGLSFAAVSGLWYSGVHKNWRIPALVFACLIAFSRLYLYVHYPTDVLAGAAVGVLCGWMAYKFFQMHTFKRCPEISSHAAGLKS